MPDIQQMDGFSLTHLRALQNPQISLLLPIECCSTTKSMKIRSSFRARQLWRWNGSGTLLCVTRELLFFSSFNKIRWLKFNLLQTYWTDLLFAEQIVHAQPQLYGAPQNAQICCYPKKICYLKLWHQNRQQYFYPANIFNLGRKWSQTLVTYPFYLSLFTSWRSLNKCFCNT